VRCLRTLRPEKGKGLAFFVAFKEYRGVAVRKEKKKRKGEVVETERSGSGRGIQLDRADRKTRRRNDREEGERRKSREEH